MNPPDPVAIDTARATWFNGYAALASAIGTFVASGVALWLGYQANRREIRRREAERAELDESFSVALGTAIDTLHHILKSNERYPDAEANKAGLLSMLATARSHLDVALGLGTKRTSWLWAAMRLRESIDALAGRLSDSPAESLTVPAQTLDTMLKGVKEAVSTANTIKSKGI